VSRTQEKEEEVNPHYIGMLLFLPCNQYGKPEEEQINPIPHAGLP